MSQLLSFDNLLYTGIALFPNMPIFIVVLNYIHYIAVFNPCKLPKVLYEWTSVEIEIINKTIHRYLEN